MSRPPVVGGIGITSTPRKDREGPSMKPRARSRTRSGGRLGCGLVALAVTPALTLARRALADTGPTFWMPVEGSANAPAVDWLFRFILIISVVFFVVTVALMTGFVHRYRRRPGIAAERTATHSNRLELTWTIIPLILALSIFYFGFKQYLDMATPPANSYDILVTAQKWNWQFTYPNGYTDGTLHVPVDTPVRLILSSEDVIHSLYIPAFRLKKDVVPGRYNKAWFKATLPGEFSLFCAEYCGQKHSDMLSTVVVHPPGEFEKWLAGASSSVDKMPPAETGARHYKARGCASCHTLGDAAGVGPSFKGIYGGTVVLSDGRKVPVDEDYLRESILDPAAKVVAGFDPVMPTYRGRVTDKEITALIEYIKSLK
jgi:cytochrome c oxidase subunit II